MWLTLQLRRKNKINVLFYQPLSWMTCAIAMISFKRMICINDSRLWSILTKSWAWLICRHNCPVSKTGEHSNKILCHYLIGTAWGLQTCISSPSKTQWRQNHRDHQHQTTGHLNFRPAQSRKRNRSWKRRRSLRGLCKALARAVRFHPFSRFLLTPWGAAKSRLGSKSVNSSVRKWNRKALESVVHQIYQQTQKRNELYYN